MQISTLKELAYLYHKDGKGEQDFVVVEKKNKSCGRMKTFWKKPFVYIIALVLCTFISSTMIQAAQLSPGDGDVIESQIFLALQDRYKGSLQQVEGGEGEESYLQLLVTFEKKQLPNIILVVNVLNRTIDTLSDQVTSNIIQVQAFPQMHAPSPENRDKFMAAIAEWQYSHVLPQRIYLTQENLLVYGWGIPLFDGDSLATESLVQIIDEQASLWIEFGGFLQEKVEPLRPLVVEQSVEVAQPPAPEVELPQTPAVQETEEQEEVAAVILEEPEETMESIPAPNYSIVETLLMLPGGRGMRLESQQRMTAFIESNKKNTAKAIIVRGYVASDNETAENQLFSRKRAEKVAQMLLDAGISASRVTIEGMGIQNPVASNATSKGRDKNRRVELLLQD